MHVSYQLTPDDFYQGMIAWRNRRKWRRWVRWTSYLLIAGASLTSLLILLLDRGGEATTIAVFTVIFGILSFVCKLLAPRLSARRQFGNNPMAQAPITLDVSEQGLEFHNLHAESKLAWSAYMAWGEAKSVFVIMPQPRAYVAIPKRAFSEAQVPEFRDMLRRNIVMK